MLWPPKAFFRVFQDFRRNAHCVQVTFCNYSKKLSGSRAGHLPSMQNGEKGCPVAACNFFFKSNSGIPSCELFGFYFAIFDATRYVRVTFCNKKVVLVVGETPT